MIWYDSIPCLMTDSYARTVDMKKPWLWWGPLHVGRWRLATNKGDSRFGMSPYLSGSSMFKERTMLQDISRSDSTKKTDIYDISPTWNHETTVMVADGSLVQVRARCTRLHCDARGARADWCCAMAQTDGLPQAVWQSGLFMDLHGLTSCFWEEIHRQNMMGINENWFQSGLQNLKHAP